MRLVRGGPCPPVVQVPHLRKQAEATLLEFRRSPNSIPVCQYVLEHSSSLPARFQVHSLPACTLVPSEMVAIDAAVRAALIGARCDAMCHPIRQP